MHSSEWKFFKDNAPWMNWDGSWDWVLSKTKTVLNDGSKHDNPLGGGGSLECSSVFTDLWYILVPHSPCKYFGIHILNKQKKKKEKERKEKD